MNLYKAGDRVVLRHPMSKYNGKVGTIQGIRSTRVYFIHFLEPSPDTIGVHEDWLESANPRVRGSATTPP
jgi:hypothetical protein